MEDTSGAAGAKREGKTRLSGRRMAIFALSSAPDRALTTLLALYLPQYLSTYIGASLPMVGYCFATIRLLDVWFDPALGVAMDNTRTRWGRYRVWLAAAVPVLALGVVFTMQLPRGASAPEIILLLLVLYLGLSMLQLASQSWAATLAKSYQDRTRIFGFSAITGIVGSLAILIGPKIALRRHAAAQGEPMRTMCLILLGLVIFSTSVAVLCTPERINPSDRSGRHPWFRDFGHMLVRPNVLRIMAADLCIGIAAVAPGSLFLFFFRDSRGIDVSTAGFLLAVLVVAGLAGAPLLTRISQRLGKHRAFMLTSVLYSISMGFLLLAPRANVIAHGLIMFSVGTWLSGFLMLLRAMLADVGDEIRLHQGREMMSVLYSLTSTTQKVSGALAIGAMFPLLAHFDYHPNATGPAAAGSIRVLELLTVGTPIVFVLLAGSCFLGWNLTAERHAVIRAELAKRDDAIQFGIAERAGL